MSATNDPQREKLRAILGERGLSESKLAKRLGIAKSHLCPSLACTDRSFIAYRYRLRVQQELGVLIWTDEREAEELAAIGKRLGLNMAKSNVNAIRRRAWERNVHGPGVHGGRPRGFRIFAALIGHFFPNSPTLQNTHYVNQH